MTMFIPDFLYPLIEKYGMKIFIDSFAVIIPPNYDNVITSTTEPGKGTLILLWKMGNIREYDPSTGTLGDEISTSDAGFYREAMHFKWHFIPLLSVVDIIPDFSFSHKGTECVTRIVNNIDKYIYGELMFVLIEYDRQYEDKIIEEIKKLAGGGKV